MLTVAGMPVVIIQMEGEEALPDKASYRGVKGARCTSYKSINKVYAFSCNWFNLDFRELSFSIWIAYPVEGAAKSICMSSTFWSRLGSARGMRAALDKLAQSRGYHSIGCGSHEKTAGESRPGSHGCIL